MKATISIIFLMLSISVMSCKNSGSGGENPEPQPSTDAVTITSTVLVDNFIGNGPQWGGYDIVPHWTGEETLSDADWNKIFKRVDYMRPSFIRIMVSAGWSYMNGTTYAPEKSEAILQKVLDYCQQKGITVQFGEWGHQEVSGSIDQDWLTNCANFLKYLIDDKGYSCIKYYTMVNEPNGDWSSTNQNYTLWSSIVKQFYTKIEALGLTSKVKIMGPDAAVWDTDDIEWITTTVSQLATEVSAYDIHAYPNEKDVRETGLSTMLVNYLAASDKSKPFVLGELGLKYSPGGVLGRENAARIAADKYASDDSQMFVYDAFYGIDVADATIQTMRSGYAGSIVWMLDDAMYNSNGASDGSAESKELKRWGFWNILGEEVFESAEDENIRPWFYPMSLMCRYFPEGTTIYDVTMPSPVKSGLRVTAGVKGGKYTIAIANNSDAEHKFTLKAPSGTTLSGVSEYRYISGSGAEYTGTVDGDGFPTPLSTGNNLDLASGVEYTIQPKSFVLLTNMQI